MEQSILNEEQQVALNHVFSGKSVFITGQGGVGKSFLINKIVNECRSRGKKVGITSTTGVSALLIKGNTIHSWAGIRLGDNSVEVLIKMVKKNKNARENWRTTDILIIDEVSMLSPELFEKLNEIGKVLRFEQTKYFGGLQLILTGDFAQLRPINSEKFIFDSPIFGEIINEIVYLKKNMRQTNEEFQKILSEIRLGKLTNNSQGVLKSRMGVKLKNSEGIKPTRLFSTKADVSYINEKELKKLEQPIVEFKVIKKVKFPKSMAIDRTMAENMHKKLKEQTMVDDILRLAKGAQVMLVKNIDIGAGLVNGSRGVVLDILEKGLLIKFVGKREPVFVSFHVSELKIPSYKNNMEFVVATREYIPLILAWALTIHKCQGATIDYVEVDLGDSVFEYGQAYVALSRVKTLEGLSILDFNIGKIRCHPKVLDFYNNLK